MFQESLITKAILAQNEKLYIGIKQKEKKNNGKREKDLKNKDSYTNIYLAPVMGQVLF